MSEWKGHSGGPHDSVKVDDLVGADSWDSRWKGVRPRRYKGYNYYHRQQSRLLRRLLPHRGRFLELGCANSLWIPHLAPDYEVWGIDYSSAGLASLQLQSDASTAHLVFGDLHDPRNGVPRRYFDVVFSDGLLEHFVDGARAASAFADYARAGGLIVTSVPNMGGWIGRLHRRVAPDHFREHVRYDTSLLDQVHREAGLVVREPATYWGHFSLGVVNYEQAFARLPRWIASSVFFGLLAVQQAVAWTMQALRLPESYLLSPHLRGVYGLPAIPLPSQSDQK
jgi:SAM-dependent methyltransferase